MDESTDAELLAHLQALEESLLVPAVRKDLGQVAALLAPEFVEFGSSGAVFTREDTLDSLASEMSGVIEATGFRMTSASQDAVLLTYTSVRVVPGQAARSALRSSLWVRRPVGWQMLFHQGTPTGEARRTEAEDFGYPTVTPTYPQD